MTMGSTGFTTERTRLPESTLWGPAAGCVALGSRSPHPGPAHWLCGWASDSHVSVLQFLFCNK